MTSALMFAAVAAFSLHLSGQALGIVAPKSARSAGALQIAGAAMSWGGLLGLFAVFAYAMKAAA